MVGKNTGTQRPLCLPLPLRPEISCAPGSAGRGNGRLLDGIRWQVIKARNPQL